MKTLYTIISVCLALSSLHSQKVETVLTDNTKEFEALHWGTDGRIYCTDYNNGRLYKITLDGNVETVVSGLSAVAGGGFDRANNFYFAAINQGKMMRLNSDNSYTEVASGFNQPVILLQNRNDDNIFYVSEYGNNRISRLKMNTGESTLLIQNQGISGPDAIIYDWDGRLLIANYNNHKIHRLNDDGTLSLFATVPSGGLMGYIIMAGDYIYAMSITGRKLYRIDREGVIEHIAGSGTPGDNDGNKFEASFRGPNGICASPSGDTLLIADDHTIRMVTNLTTTGVKEYSLALDNFVGAPNPVKDTMKLSFDLTKKQKLTYEIINFEGSYVSDKQDINAIDGENTIFVDCSYLVAGLYFIKMVNTEGKVFTYNFYKI